MTIKKSPLAPAEFPNMPSISGVEIGVHAVGFKYQKRFDYAVFRVNDKAMVSGVFTTSSTYSSAVEYSRRAIQNGGIKAIAVNAGNSNAFTGKKGKQANDALAFHTMRLCGFDVVDGDTLPVVCCSTGVIGEVLDTKNLAQLPALSFDATWEDAGNAICTTDTFAKGSTRTVLVDGKTITINGIAKGSGMIAPNMATMLAYIFTDANIDQVTLDTCVRQMSDVSFNAITVDGDTSTSDSVILTATGMAGNDPMADLTAFKQALKEVFVDLACQIVKDGEGATKFIKVDVSGAKSSQDAKTIAMAIANSPLVKTAIAGEDANWGRIVMAVGKSGAYADRDSLSISVGGVVIAQNGEGVDEYDETPVQKHLQGTDINICVDLNVGNATSSVWTCDLTHEYISINAHYRS